MDISVRYGSSNMFLGCRSPGCPCCVSRDLWRCISLEGRFHARTYTHAFRSRLLHPCARCTVRAYVLVRDTIVSSPPPRTTAFRCTLRIAARFRRSSSRCLHRLPITHHTIRNTHVLPLSTYVPRLIFCAPDTSGCLLHRMDGAVTLR